MKSIFVIFTLLFCLNLHAKEKSNFTITNSNWDNSISIDSILISGRINYNKKPDLNSFGKVASLDFKVANIVARSGEYAIKISRAAKGYYFFQEGYREVIVNLQDYTDANHFQIDIVGEQYFALIQAEKPIIYLYSDKTVQTDLTLSPVGELSFTYPHYNKNWQVETQKNGDIKNLKSGKSHPYLFWEANHTNINFKNASNVFEGYLIQTDTVVQFLENRLTQFGLNAKESTDFITYWAPRLMQKQYAIIQFMIEDDYHEVFGGIHSSTPLDFKLRIGMLYEVTEFKPSLKIRTPKPILMNKRHGFSLIEWGGIELKGKLIYL